MVKRLSKEERKKEIILAAIKLFLLKGFSKVTMEDIVSETTLSKGGVYYYYKNIKDIIFDIFVLGNNYRMQLIKDYIKNNNLCINNLTDYDIAEMIIEKIFTTNNLMEVYAQFLIEAMYDNELYKLYIKIVEKSKTDLVELGIMRDKDFDSDSKEFEFIKHFINIFIIGINVLDAKEIFRENRDLIKELIITVIKKFRNK